MQEGKQQHSLTLSLQVINGNELESGRAVSALFTTDGGSVGHAESCRWSVQDRGNTVSEQAFTVIWHDGAFCIKSHSLDIAINQAPVPVNSGLVRLRQGDEILLGSLTLKAFLHQGEIISYDKQMATPETIVMNRDNLVNTLLTTDGQPHYPGMSIRHDIAQTVAHAFSTDPLQVLQTESLTNMPGAYNTSPSSTPPMSDVTESGGIEHRFMDLPASDAQQNTDEPGDEFFHENMNHRHLALSPLMRGLGCSLSIRNSQEADDFLEEVGRALQKAIKGLLNLQHQQNSLSDKHLRPLEDNPLRLNLDYDTALSVMFAENKSPVHLAAPSAIEESLRNIHHHEQANQAAITEALRIMLDAFSPASLMRRFVQYRRSNEQRQEMDDAWAWRMYSSYYEELASSRQQGFEMLFSEVYAQVYDRVLRDKQRASEE